MLIEIDNKKYAVKFSRQNTGTMVEIFHKTGTTTHAYLYNVREDGSLKYSGKNAHAYLHPNDRFSKSKGRKVALAKLLKILRWNKEQRTSVWNAYFEKHKK